MKGILLTTNLERVKSVYTDDLIRRIRGRIDLEQRYYTLTDICSRPAEFSDVDCIFSTWYMPALKTDEILRLFPRLKCLFYAAGTVKYFARPFFDADVRIYSAASANGIPVAEFAAAQIILAGKGYFQAQARYKRFGFARGRKIAESHAGNYRSRVGILGLGKIGSRVAELLRTYNVEVYAYDPYADGELCERLGCRMVTLERIFGECDVISNHLPDLDSTRGVLDYELFRTMKPYSTFINTGRGAQVRERDLARVLRRRKDICALLDVTRHEPLFPWNPLNWLGNVFLSPHIAGSLGNENQRMGAAMCDALDAWLDGEESEYRVTAEMIENMA